MKALARIALVASCLSPIEAINLFKRSSGELPATVQIDIQRREFVNPIEHDRLRRRQSSTLQVTLDNEQTLYFANCSIGTPAQPFRLHIDTGSSDLWVNSRSASPACTQGSCSISGVYNPNASSTYNYINSVFNISYVDGSGASGDYATDILSIGGVALSGFQFGVGYQSTNQQGILGIGYTINEVQVNRARLSPYPNLPQALLDAGRIQSNAYSLWLNDLSANTGSILFGGVNTEKYIGTLATLPIVPFNVGGTSVHAEFLIALTGLGVGGAAGSISPNLRIPVLLDSGTSLSYLPNAYAQTLFNQFRARYDARQQIAFVDCNLANSNSTIDFTFSSPTISVPLNEMVLVAGYYGRQPICILGIAPAGDGTAILGDTFLRSAYVVYDLTNNEISIAPTNFNATRDNILEITNGPNGVPDATAVPEAVATVTGATASARLGTYTVAITGLATSTGGAAAKRTGLPLGGAAAAAAAGAGLLFAL